MCFLQGLDLCPSVRMNKLVNRNVKHGNEL